ncbi:MAG: hypothetical protein AB4062_21990 [Crocosphaera sp.]
MIKKLTFLGLFTTISALSAHSAAQAAVFNINNNVEVVSVSIDPLASSFPHVVAELAQTTTTPESGSVIPLLGLGFVAAKGKKQA